MADSKKSVLIIEDEVPLRKIFIDHLNQLGIRVLEASDGETGLMLALDYHPDLILLDILMPKMHGMAMLRKLRADAWGKIVPVIILTNLYDPSNEQEAKNELHAEYFVKANLRFEDILETIKKTLHA